MCIAHTIHPTRIDCGLDDLAYVMCVACFGYPTHIACALMFCVRALAKYGAHMESFASSPNCM